MKLRNKKTGEIKPWDSVWSDHRIHSLAELNKEWEDYEEPKELYWVNYDSSISHTEEGTMSFGKQKLIGNYFETKEEAEKAVEKLKAWKRLKDKGFRFVGVRGIGKAIDFDMPKPYHHVAFDEYTANEDELDFYNDLMMLFGGEE